MENVLQNVATDDQEVVIHELMNQYGQQVLQLAFTYVKNKEIAEDLTQDIFVKCYKALSTYNGTASLKTWLWKIAMNHCKDFLKSWYNRNVSVTAEEEQRGTAKELVEQAVLKNETDDELIAAIMQLDVRYREVIYLHYYEDLPLRDISTLTGHNINTIKTRLRKAKALLKAELEG
ncbi:RNA polymerase factor sigma C [Fictibacillus macauensis ZFHKF-1]|uniref:RNA polymerase factor sigma C n=1 Tax=Fictibacillus macauensis ZFHKF-1 TaxID=1196324 RepID=I8AG62_9BACL|nr:sigma-70 family RNA polymerase sigma factor [Fictibacillus macauensis]EIT84389.1 RNA polymerase factor sigma C [Fictibacillus macauensis ZFHKF-1]